jgi:trigger factor
MSYEVIPEFDVADLSSFKVVREVVEVPAEEVEEQVLRVAENSRSAIEPKKGKAADGDKVTIDYLGKVDGEPFEGGADQDAELVIGSNRFIPGFEEQLVGLKEGDEKVITVSFPADYQAAHLAGKEATFDIKVKAVAAPGELEINDELAKSLGLESADKLREIVKLADRETSMAR